MAQRLSPLTRAPGLRRLGDLARQGALPQSLLLEGPEGSGKEAAAIELACLLLCAPALDANCGRTARALLHPDLRFAFPVEASLSDLGLRELLDAKAREPLSRIRQPGSAILPIGEPDDPSPCSIRELRRFVSMKPFSAEKRVVIVADAHRMNRSAANALLKTLEEPPPCAQLILCTHQPRLLPATVRSRCTRVRVPGLREDELANHLEAAHGLDAAQAAQLAAACGGNARRALDLVDPQARRLAGWAAALLERLLQRRVHELLRGAELLAKGQDPTGAQPLAGKLADASLSTGRDLGMRTLDFMVADLVALARLRAGATVAAARQPWLAPMVASLGDRDPAAMADVLLRARDDLARNVNVSLVLTHAFCEALRARGSSDRTLAAAAAPGDGDAAQAAVEAPAAEPDPWQG
jgi:hypothetical protein